MVITNNNTEMVAEMMDATMSLRGLGTAAETR